MSATQSLAELDILNIKVRSEEGKISSIVKTEKRG